MAKGVPTICPVDSSDNPQGKIPLESETVYGGNPGVIGKVPPVYTVPILAYRPEGGQPILTAELTVITHPVLEKLFMKKTKQNPNQNKREEIPGKRASQHILHAQRKGC